MSDENLGLQVKEFIVYAVGSGISYDGLVKAMIKAMYPDLNVYAERRLVKKLQALIESIRNAEKPRTPYDMPIEEAKQIIMNWRGTAYLIDNLGLPEIYEILRYSRQLGRNINFARIIVFINPWGNTAAFKMAFGENSMMEIARKNETDLIRGTDKHVHHVFRDSMDIEELISNMNRELKEYVIHLIENDLEIQDNNILIIADHGYDIECEGTMCRLCHGGDCMKPTFSLITPLVLL